jgi:predicted protein tyrosine phosphatase
MMEKKRVLFVCAGNRDRSPTAQEMFRYIKGWETRSAGVGPYANNVVTKELIQWAEIIFAMEESQKQFLIRMDNSCTSKIRVLEIPDEFRHNQPDLKQVLSDKMRHHISQLNSQ